MLIPKKDFRVLIRTLLVHKKFQKMISTTNKFPTCSTNKILRKKCFALTWNWCVYAVSQAVDVEEMRISYEKT